MKYARAGQLNGVLHINSLVSLFMVLGGLIKPHNEPTDNEEINMYKHLLSALEHDWACTNMP